VQSCGNIRVRSPLRLRFTSGTRKDFLFCIFDAETFGLNLLFNYQDVYLTDKNLLSFFAASSSVVLNLK